MLTLRGRAQSLVIVREASNWQIERSSKWSSGRIVCADMSDGSRIILHRTTKELAWHRPHEIPSFSILALAYWQRSA